MNYRLALLITIQRRGLHPTAEQFEKIFSPEFNDQNPNSAHWVFEGSSESAMQFSKIPSPWWVEAESEIHVAHTRGVKWSYPGCEDYPDIWYSLSKFPVLIAYLGQPVWKTHKLLAVVGSRTPSRDTLRWMQTELGQWCKQSGQGIVSGGARGVDQWAHKISVAYQRPTVVILPTGVCNPYPFNCTDLWRDILAGGGCLLSPFGLDVPLWKSAFVIRNRWIAGLSDVCFVVEAKKKSGSAMTARLALDEGRTICTLPVSALASQGLANLDLISDGAHMIRDAQDLYVVTELNNRRR